VPEPLKKDVWWRFSSIKGEDRRTRRPKPSRPAYSPIGKGIVEKCESQEEVGKKDPATMQGPVLFHNRRSSGRAHYGEKSIEGGALSKVRAGGVLGRHIQMRRGKGFLMVGFLIFATGSLP